MKILLVNNNTIHLEKLNKSLMGHDVEIQMYEPGLCFNDANKDLVILSGGGGEGTEIHDSHKTGRLWYEDQMEYVLRSDKPIIGICMGFEVIASAYGQKVQEMDKTIEQFMSFGTTKHGLTHLNKKTLRQYEAHKWHVPRFAHKEFEILADSDYGVEVIKHKKRPIFATQFHPEIPGGSLQLSRLVFSSAN